MNSDNIVKLARDGNSSAIAALINRHIQKKGITAKALLQENCLQILLESKSVPPQEELVAFIERGILQLNPNRIITVEIHGRQIGQIKDSWQQSFQINSNFEKRDELDLSETHINSVKSSNDPRNYDERAYCPNCGSSHIQLKQETNVSWGRAVAGWVLFGPLAGAVGAVTGADRNVNACLNCGETWKPQDLYKTRELIKYLIGKNINLSKETHRAYINIFVAEVSPCMEEIKSIEKKYQHKVSKIEKEALNNTTNGCAMGCAGSLGLLFTVAGAGFSAGGILLVLLLVVAIPFLGLGIGVWMDNSKKLTYTKLAEGEKEKEKEEKLSAERRLMAKVEHLRRVFPE